MVAGSFDFLGLNTYSTQKVYPEEGDINTVSFYEDDGVGTYVDETFYK